MLRSNYHLYVGVKSRFTHSMCCKHCGIVPVEARVVHFYRALNVSCVKTVV